LLVAAVLRTLAVIFARGYLASDDYFETIGVALHWAHGHFWTADGFVNWPGCAPGGLMRSPLYNLFLAAQLKIASMIGLSTLSQQLYLVSAVHALLSLLPMYFGYRYVYEREQPQAALTAGLLLAAFYPLPFLSVRTLIEVVSGNLLVPALYYADRAWRNSEVKSAAWSGLLIGAVWLIRPPAAVVAAPVFVLLLIACNGGRGAPAAHLARRAERRRSPTRASGLPSRLQLGTALAFAAPVIALALLEGVTEIATAGRFMGAMINYFRDSFSDPTVAAPWYRYGLLLLGAFIPPFSIWFLASQARVKIVREHAVFWWSAVIFIVIHSIVPNKQERFMFPILTTLLVLGAVGVYSLPRNRWFGKPALLKWPWTYFWIVNVVLLAAFTFNYSHRGRVEPFVYLGEQADVRGVAVDCTRRNLTLLPDCYAGFPPPPVQVHTVRPESATPFLSDTVNYLLVFADDYPAAELMRWRELAGPWELVRESPPSMVDRFLEWINPKYNHSNRSWLFRKVE
jgi:hypothetical protein